jgi:hypothetical protein
MPAIGTHSDPQIEITDSWNWLPATPAGSLHQRSPSLTETGWFCRSGSHLDLNGGWSDSGGKAISVLRAPSPAIEWFPRPNSWKMSLIDPEVVFDGLETDARHRRDF